MTFSWYVDPKVQRDIETLLRPVPQIIIDRTLPFTSRVTGETVHAVSLDAPDYSKRPTLGPEMGPVWPTRKVYIVSREMFDSAKEKIVKRAEAERERLLRQTSFSMDDIQSALSQQNAAKAYNAMVELWSSAAWKAKHGR